MRVTDSGHVVLQLIEVGIRSEDRACRSAVGGEQTIAEQNRWLGMVGGGKERRAPYVSDGRLKTQMRTDRARVGHAHVALVIEELDGKTGVNRSLIGIRDRPRHLVQTEPRQQLRLVGDAMIHANRKLIGNGCRLRRCSKRSCAVGAGRIVGQRIGVEHGLDRRIHGNGERVSGKGNRVDTEALIGSGHWEDLGGTENLSESLILAKEEGAIAAVIDGEHDRPADRPAKLVANKRRNAAMIEPHVIKVVARVERCVA